MNLQPLLIDRGLKRVGSEADLSDISAVSALPPKADTGTFPVHPNGTLFLHQLNAA